MPLSIPRNAFRKSNLTSCVCRTTRQRRRQSLEINSITERDIGEFLRTQHMNDLETEAIFNVCSEFADVFTSPVATYLSNSVKHYSVPLMRVRFIKEIIVIHPT